MQYARCTYHIAIFADEQQRAAHPIARSALRAYAEHACALMGCQLFHAEALHGALQILVEVRADMPVDSFIDCLKRWTSSWITRTNDAGYWLPGAYLGAVSPEEKQLMTHLIDESNEQSVAELAGTSSMRPTLHCMHMIIITSRERLLLPLKHSALLTARLKSIAEETGATAIDLCAMRNHMHLLCLMPSDIAPAPWIDSAKTRLYEWMQAQKQFCKIDPWHEDSIIYTVSPSKTIDEEHTIARQNGIHARKERQNEMSLLYQRLDIPWVASLH